MLVGYGRTSTVEQEAGLEAQERDLRAAGCDKVFGERVSSVAKRAQLEAALEFVRQGDTLVVAKLDRLARSVADLLGIVARLEAKGVALRVLAIGGQPLDTGTATGKLMLTMLGAVAEFERALMLERQREGIAKAKAEGRTRGASRRRGQRGRTCTGCTGKGCGRRRSPSNSASAARRSTGCWKGRRRDGGAGG